MKPAKAVFNIINEYTRQKVDDPITKVLENGVIVGLANHTILIRRDGTEVAIDDSGAPIRDRNGNITGVVLSSATSLSVNDWRRVFPIWHSSSNLRMMQSSARPWMV